MLFPRPGRPGAGSRRPVVALAPVAFFPFHHVNAYERPDGQLVIDTVGWNEVDFEMSKFITSPVSRGGGDRGSTEGEGEQVHHVTCE